MFQLRMVVYPGVMGTARVSTVDPPDAFLVVSEKPDVATVSMVPKRKGKGGLMLFK